MKPSSAILYVDDEIINLELFSLNFRKKFKVLNAVPGNVSLHKLRLPPKQWI